MGVGCSAYDEEHLTVCLVWPSSGRHHTNQTLGALGSELGAWSDEALLLAAMGTAHSLSGCVLVLVPLTANGTLCLCSCWITDVWGVSLSYAEVMDVLGAEQLNVVISARFSEREGASRCEAVRAKGWRWEPADACW